MAALALLDLFLKVGTGSGVLEKLSSATRHRVIVLTNSASAENRKRSLPIGVLAIDDKTSALEPFSRPLPSPPDHQRLMG